jgi:hypothetical protein
MRRIVIIAVAALVALAPACAQSRQDLRAAKKEAAEAAKTLKRDGYKPIELGNVQTRLEKYFLKTYAGCAQVIGVAENCISTNMGQVTALANAANQYAILAGGDIRGRLTSSITSMNGQQMDNLVSSFERLVEKEIRGELIPYVTAVRERRGAYSVRAYCIIDEDAAAQVRRRALMTALEEQKLAEQYGSMVSNWIDEGFRHE